MVRKAYSISIFFLGLLLLPLRAEEHVPGTNLWSTQLYLHTETSPAVATNGVIYVSGADGRLRAFSPAGRPLWTFKTRLRLEMCSSPAIGEDGTIYVGSRDKALYAVWPNGKLRWRFKTGGWVDTSAAIGADGAIHFGSWDGIFYAVTPDGRLKWQFATDGPILSSAAIDAKGTIYFGTRDGRLVALNPDGSKRWEFPTRGRIISSPALANNGDLLFTSLDGKLYDLNNDGQLRWSLPTGGITISSPVVAEDGNIYVGANQFHLFISPDGKIRWRGGLSPTGYVPYDWIRSTPMVLGNGNVVTMGTDSLLTVFKSDGNWIWNFSMLTGSYSSPAIGLDGTIYAVALGGKMFALQSAIPLARSSWPMFRGNPQHTGRVREPLQP